MDHLTPRPTTYRGTRMRSRLEAAYAEQFDAFKWRWTYEPGCFASPDGQYLPDFHVIDNKDQSVYVEVKPIVSSRQVHQVVDDSARWCRIIEANKVAASALLLCFGANAGRIATIIARHLYVTHDRRSWTVLHPTINPVPSLHASMWL